MQSTSLFSSGPIDYRSRMAPREKAWKENFSQTEERKKGISKEKKTNPISFIKNLIVSEKKNITPNVEQGTEDAYIRMGNTYIPYDVIKSVIAFADYPTLLALRKCTKKWKVLVESYPLFWKTMECEKIRKEFPSTLLDAFRGPEKIQDIDFIHLNHTRYGELFVKKNSEDKIDVEGKVILSLSHKQRHRIHFITHQMFEGKSVFRGIDPYGCHYICLKLFRNETPVVVVFQEDAPAFRALRERKIFGWVTTTTENQSFMQNERADPYSALVSNSKNEDTICVFHENKEISSNQAEIVKKIQLLLAGHTIETRTEWGTFYYSFYPQSKKTD